MTNKTYSSGFCAFGKRDFGLLFSSALYGGRFLSCSLGIVRRWCGLRASRGCIVGNLDGLDEVSIFAALMGDVRGVDCVCTIVVVGEREYWIFLGGIPGGE